MTMIVGTHFPEGIVVIADSRITLLHRPRRLDYQDILQKILPFAPNVAIAFAGNVSVASAVFRGLGELLRANPELRNIGVVGPRLGGELKRIYEEWVSRRTQYPETDFMLAGYAPDSGDPRDGQLFSYRHPDFTPKRIQDSFDVLGSGEVVIPYVQENWPTLASLQANDLKTKADWLNVHLEDELRRHGLLNVGGLFQIIIIEPGGIRPMRYGYLSVDPESDDEAFEMFMEQGFWYQRNLRTGTTVRLQRPGQVQLRPLRVRDLIAKPGAEDQSEFARARSGASLNYLVVSGGVKREPGRLEFMPTMNMVAAPRFPARMDLIVSLSLRAGTGSHVLGIHMVDREGEEAGAADEVNVSAVSPITDIVRDMEIPFVCPRPDVWFIEARIDGVRIGRRSFVVAEMIAELGRQPLSAAEHSALMQRQIETLTRRQLEGSDPVLASGERKSILNYFVPCADHSIDDVGVSFTGMFDVVITSHFPQDLRVMLASSLRAAPGAHAVRVDLLDLASQERILIDTVQDMESTAYLRDMPIRGEVVLRFPRQAIYALEQYLDDEMCARAIIAADDVGNLKYVRLDNAEAERVRQGEVLLVTKTVEGS